MTGVASRHVGKYIAAILVLLGLFPVIGRAFYHDSSPVLGGAMVLMFGLIAIAGADFGQPRYSPSKRSSRLLLSVWVWAWRLNRKCSKPAGIVPKFNFCRRYYGGIVELGVAGRQNR